jgi:hypothetical protein
MYNLVHSLFEILATDEARTLLGLGVSLCRTRTHVMSDTSSTPIITLNYVIFLNY